MSIFDRPRSKSKSELFQFIRNKGGDEARVHYSGGGDEGGVNSIEIVAAGGKVVCTLNEPYSSSRYDPATQSWVTEKSADPDAPFLTDLCAPVYDKYGGFAGETYVDGVITWDANTCTIKDVGNAEVPQTEHYDEDVR